MSLKQTKHCQRGEILKESSQCTETSTVCDESTNFGTSITSDSLVLHLPMTEQLMKRILPERAGPQTNLGLLSLQGLLKKQEMFREGVCHFFLFYVFPQGALHLPPSQPLPTGLSTLFSFYFPLHLFVYSQFLHVLVIFYTLSEQNFFLSFNCVNWHKCCCSPSFLGVTLNMKCV